ncbi:MAG: hypothetical protein LQ350_008152 [Teloschistes chrysophthalmus]|nr:MAG: hypothetical protein LQ350_008152 [Niorma chrysophthalma]
MNEQEEAPLTRLPFPPVTRSHILHCSYHYWHPLYRKITPKARLIPLTPPFLSYLRADGIILPPETPTPSDPLASTDTDSGIFSASSTPTGFSSEDEDEDEDPSLQWPEIHEAIFSTIAELGGNVVPKLNWSAPKDATWINATNSMECRTPNDIYLLLKSSDFITHDLEQAFDGCEKPAASSPSSTTNPKNQKEQEQETTPIPYTLTLRKTIPSPTTSLEFRCFVRSRRLLAASQRDMTAHYPFLPALLPTLLRPLIASFLTTHIIPNFPDENFVVDVYVPPPHKRVWLIDVNPWAPRTDPEEDLEEEEIQWQPEFRLVNRDDPEAYSFASPQYSAHKMPKDVVDAASGEAGLREFMGRWREIVQDQERERGDGEAGV